MKKTILYFIIIIFFSIIIHAEAVNKNKTTHYKIRKENGEFIIDYNSKSDTIRNLNEFAKKYSTGSKKSKSDKIKNENKKCFSRDLSNKYLSLKESYQFKLDTTKYAFPMGSSAFNFYKKKLVTTVLDKNTKTSNLNGYSLALSSGNKLEKAILLFDCENRTEPKRFGTTGKSREAFGKTHSLQFNDDKIISFQVGKIGIWNKDAILEKIFEVEHSFTGNRFVIENNSIYGSSSWPLLLDSVKSCIKLDFEKSKYEEGTYDISYSKAFYDISDFEKRYKLDKLFIEDDETSNNINKYFCESVVPGTSTLSKGEDVFFLLNNSGKAILEMDYDLNIINSYPLNELVERRDIELFTPLRVKKLLKRYHLIPI